MSLAKMAYRRGGQSYGEVPGIGHPKADDKNMIAGKGHVVPAENAHIAKEIVADMGYEPNVNVSMNQGGSSGVPIKISSGEYFLNDEQVKEMKSKGMNPEMLSPNSPYNKTVGMKNGGKIDMGLYNLMMNNNNQYPNYQDGGGTPKSHAWFQGKRYAYDPELQSYNFPGAVGETGPIDYQKSTAMDYSPEGALYDPNNPRPTVEQYKADLAAKEAANKARLAEMNAGDPTGGLTVDKQTVQGSRFSPSLMDRMVNKPPKNQQPQFRQNDQGGWEQLASDTNDYVPMDPNATPMYDDATGEVIGFDYSNTTPNDTAQEKPFDENDPSTYGNMLPDLNIPGQDPNKQKDQPITQNDQTGPPDPNQGNEPAGQSPEDRYLDDLIQKNQKNADLEVITNLAMLGWNTSRERQGIPEPRYVGPREMVRDYEGMKNQAESDLERQKRGSDYQLKQMGRPDLIVGTHANTVQGQNSINQSIWDMQNQDSMRNIQSSNVAKQHYYDQLYSHGIREAAASTEFSREKGANMAQNVAQIFDVRDNKFNNETYLKGLKTNEEMNELDQEYNALDKRKIMSSGKGYVSRKDWYKMTPEQRNQYKNVS